MKNFKVASRYAKALFDLALENNSVEAVKRDMELIRRVFSENRELTAILINPVVSIQKKNSILKALFEKHIEALSLGFMLLIVKKRREANFTPIAIQYLDLYLGHINTIEVTLTSAQRLDESLKYKITSLVKQSTDREVFLIEKTDESLIGGFLLNYKDLQYDASIRKKLGDLKKEFEENLYIGKI